MLKKMANALVVGAGLTGAASAALLKQHVPELASITIWDKSRGAGGRMSTTRCPEDGSITADLGAQYITLTQEYMAKRQSLYKELQEHGILNSMKGKVEGPNNFDKPGADHFVAPQGVSSVVKYFLQKSGAEIKYQRTISGLTTGNDITVSTKENVNQNFDIVILTLPVPQLLQLQGSIPKIFENQSDIKRKLEAVSYSSRYALAIFFPPDHALNVPWSARYLTDDPIIRYMAVDQVKRGVGKSCAGQSLVVHTNVPYGLKHVDDDMNKVKAEIMSRLTEYDLPLSGMLSSKIQRWRYSQVHKSYDGSPGCVVINKKPLIIITGDAFTHSTFDGCIDSAEAVCKTVQQILLQNKTGL